MRKKNFTKEKTFQKALHSPERNKFHERQNFSFMREIKKKIEFFLTVITERNTSSLNNTFLLGFVHRKICTCEKTHSLS